MIRVIISAVNDLDSATPMDPATKIGREVRYIGCLPSILTVIFPDMKFEMFCIAYRMWHMVTSPEVLDR